MTPIAYNTNTPRDGDESAGPGPLPVNVTMDGGDARDLSSAERLRLADYPALAALRLTGDDLDELCHQGFVRQETRGSLGFYKLRFRRARQQVVRYIADAGQAASVRVELARLQADRRLQRELGRLTRSARRMLRESKKNLEPIVETAGLKFHGLAIRRPRKPNNPR